MRPSLSCSVLRVKKLLRALTAGSLAATLAGCTVMDVVGPRPNREIMALARQAEADALGDAGGDFAAVRRDQADALKAEVLRLCGTDPQGEVPSSCHATHDAELPAATTTDGVLELTVDTVPQLPEESVDLVVAQAVDVAAIAPVDLEHAEQVSLDDVDVPAVQHLLAQEYALDYGLGVATAYGDDALRGRITALREASADRAVILTAALAAAGAEVPVPAAGYKVVHAEAPTDLAGAAGLVERLRGDLVADWRLAAAHAQHDAWRRAAILLAAHAQQA